MKALRYPAAAGALIIHVGVLAMVLTMAGPTVVLPLLKPIEIALIPPEPLPAPAPPKVVEAPTPPEALPMQNTPPRRPPVEKVAPRRPVTPEPVARPEPRPEPSPSMPKEPPPKAAPEPAPVVVAKPVEEPRPAPITAPVAPPEAPVAPRVVEPVNPAPVARVTPPAAPAREGPRVDASWSGNAPPPYPTMARRMGEEGEVRLDVHVGAEGNVLEVVLKKSSGSELLDRAAMETVRKWRFKPATIDGKPVAAWYQNWRWNFKLES